MDFQKSKNTVIKFVNENKVLIISQNDYKESFKIKFTLEGKDFGKYDSLIQTLGYQTTKNTNTVSNYQKYKELTLELEYLKTKKNSYLELMQKIDEKSEVYINLWHDKNKIDDNILFIDASNEFEKQKNQNKLLPEHLDNIIGAFENRQNIEKYAHVATLKEVKENDFNLNIPRYVDTFEAEAEIDLDAIAKQLQALEHDSQKTDAIIADFCKELGIVSPFAEVK